MTGYETLHADEVSDIGAFLRALSDEQWEHPTLCTEFTVRHMIGHMLSASEEGPWRVLRRLPAAGFNFDRVSVAMARERADHRAPRELIADFEAHNPRSGLTRIVPQKSTFLERVVHHQDMRRPLGIPREIPPTRLQAALDLAVSGHHGVKSNRRAAGLALQATDLDWSHGEGPTVTGPGESILMALCGRSVAVEELSGDGVTTLRERQPSAKV